MGCLTFGVLPPFILGNFVCFIVTKDVCVCSYFMNDDDVVVGFYLFCV